MKTQELQALIAALEDLKLNYRTIKAIPFSNKIPTIDVPNPIVALGTTTLIKNAVGSSWKPGVFYTPEKFRAQPWIKHYGTNYINHDADILTMAEIDRCWPGTVLAEVNEIFIRPNSDLKIFAGEVLHRDKYWAWYDMILKRKLRKLQNTEVVLNRVKKIEKEWRIFVVDGEPVAGSQYSVRRELKLDPFVPESVYTFVREMSRKWAPELAFVMDVGELDSGDLQIIELNCLNGCGFYLATIRSVISAVSEAVDRYTTL